MEPLEVQRTTDDVYPRLRVKARGRSWRATCTEHGEIGVRPYRGAAWRLAGEHAALEHAGRVRVDQ